VRREDLTRRFESDPLLKVGTGAMILALGFAIVVAVATFLDQPIEPAAARPEVKSATKPLVRSDPSVDPWVEKDIPPPRAEIRPTPSTPSEPTVDSQQVSVSKPNPLPEPETRSGDSSSIAFRSRDSGGSGVGDASDQSRQALPLDENNFPLPTDEQLQATNRPRHYHLPPGAIMSLTIRDIGLHNAPVLNSDSRRALDQGVIHLPDTSLPWSDTPERNVYLAGHRLGWPGTGSHLVFYRLNQLDRGDRITLRDREGRRYDYRVLETFTVGPDDSWVTGVVRGRDLLTLQTCTPIPTFQWRLIVRAERN
jgi:LPXTG-site transpeptidase (sortase) family protein